MSIDDLRAVLRLGDTSETAVGSRLKLLRKVLGLTQRGMAAAMGTTVNNYQAVEYGKQHPRPHQVQSLMDAYGLDYNLIYGGDPKGCPAGVALKLLAAHKADDGD
jgi:Predicted transcriptional regulators